MARSGGPGTRLVFDYSDYRFAPVPVVDLLRAAGFDGFDSTGLGELWHRHLRGDPHPFSAALRMGVARISG